MKRANIPLARSLRETATKSEQTLWKSLRNRQLGGYKFRRQHGVTPYVLDFYCAEALLAVELDGDVHGIPEQEKHDRRRDQFLTALGIEVLRFWNEDVRTNLEGVMETTRRALEQRTMPPHLNPLSVGVRRPEGKLEE